MIGLKPVSVQQEINLPNRIRLRIKGAVQGVGFRPCVYGLARRMNLTGWVLNDGDGVLIEVQGINAPDFATRLKSTAPSLSRIDDIEETVLPPQGEEAGFSIHKSNISEIITDIIPDVAACPDCLAEMRNPEDRRYGYAFLNCTNCGPRYSITHNLPYDRAQTSMAPFQMCERCEDEYNDPENRRFHAQPTCCPDCGPELSISVPDMAAKILAGEILAIKGLGGFHLVCNAHDEDAIARLRERKNREAKPFAVMVPNVHAITFAKVDEHERSLLESVESPIVLLQKKSEWHHASTPRHPGFIPGPSLDAKTNTTPNGSRNRCGMTEGGCGMSELTLPENIAPGLNRIGVMLPYTPLHHLLLDALNGTPLVMTSANPGGEPLVIDNDEAHDRLGGIADTIVTHNRDILIRVDDSVVRSDLGQTTFMRRARGFTPSPIFLKDDGPTVLALGAYLKNTICLTRKNQAYLSQHIGDLDNVATIRFQEETLAHLKNILRVDPELVVHDLHPDFASTQLAKKLGIPSFAVQHHHAHIASVIAEHQLDGPVLGLALDGFGLGSDGGSWGGELLRVEGLSCDRLGHLHEIAQPGGDKAARQPWRMGASILHQLGRTDEMDSRFPNQDTKTLNLMLDKGLNAPLTSSAGRLFDAACGLLGICPQSHFEGQAPMMLESMVTRIEVLENGWQINDGELDFLPLLDAISHLGSERGANLFHGTLIAGFADWIEQSALTHNIPTIALSGGCFLNQILSQGLIRKLQQRGLRPYLNQQAPLSDAGLSLGQAWLGQLFLKQEC